MIIPVSLGYTVRITVEQQLSTPRDGITLYVGGSGAGNYTKIQDAIDNASEGDTVFVSDISSPYYENIIIDRSIDLIGEDKNSTIIEFNNEKEIIVKIVADGVTLKGFTIINSWKEAVYIIANNTILSDNIIGPNIQGYGGYGILLLNSNNNFIVRNVVSKTFDAIQILASNNNTITDNKIISNNLYGIWLSNSDNNIVSENYILTGPPFAYPGSYKGIRLTDSNNNFITGNVVISQDMVSYGGIQLDESGNNIVSDNEFVQCGLEWHGLYNNLLKNNSINGKPLLYLIGKKNQVIENAGQVILIQCTGCTIQNLVISNTKNGIDLFETNNCLIKGNNIINNWRGINLEFSNNNEIVDNEFSDNKYGISVNEGSHHTVISDNLVKDSRYNGISTRGAFNSIQRNTIINSTEGLIVGGIFSFQNSIKQNVIQHNKKGLQLISIRYSTISSNIISDNTNGLYVRFLAKRNNIILNEITNNVYGINLSYSNVNTITQNNLIGNEQHASFDTAFRNRWKHNYWDDTIVVPVQIDGMISFYRRGHWGEIIWEHHIPWTNFDWNPAKEPFDIGGYIS